MKKYQKVKMHSADEVEIIFYEAFMHGDIDVMRAIWANEDIICVHPGSGVIEGYDSIMRSWQHILENSNAVDLRYHIEKTTSNNDMSIHVVREEILESNNVIAVVVATNIFKKFENGWLMIEHHGSIVNTEKNGETLQ